MKIQTCLITGGTGSFGHAFVSHLLENTAARIIVFSRDELKQSEMRRRFGNHQLEFFLGDVRDRARLETAFNAGVDAVVHAAALKRVTACEYNPFETVKTNVLGAQNVIEAALACNVRRIIALSTDKACNPVNVYGASKLMSEKLFTQGNAYAGARDVRFACVRYGNVLGSRGSVVSLFKEQSERGEITITDKDMTRFWIRIEDAVSFVLSSLEMMKGGEVFVPKMQSFRVMNLARLVDGTCPIRFIGKRPGEKLHEVLISADEAYRAIELDDRYVILPQTQTWSDEQLIGKPVEEDFIYRSDLNQDWWKADELRSAL